MSIFDSHGLVYDTDKNREKQELCINIRKEYEPIIRSRLKEKGIETEVLLDAYIISVTDPKTVHEAYLGMPIKSHVVHQRDPGYIRQIFEGIPIFH